MAENKTPEQIVEDINVSIEAIKAKAANKEDLTSLKSDLNTLIEANKDVTDAQKLELEDLQEQLNVIKEKSTRKLNDFQKYNLRKAVEDNHEDIVNAIKNERPFEITFKAAAMHMTNNGTVTNDASLDYPVTDNFLVDNDIAKIRYPDNFLLNVIPNIQVSNVPAQRIRKEQAATEGAAALTVEGAVKPLTQYKFVRTTTDRVKYAGRIEWTEEFVMDFEALYREILMMFEEDVIRVWQAGLLAEISTNASSYVSSVLDDTFVAPDNGLAIIAGQSQLQSLNYEPDVVIMSPSDVVATMFQQDADGNLKAAPYINITSGTLNGMRLVTNNSITVGTAYIGESRLYREQHSDFILRTGQYGDQLIENEYTAIGEVFSILQIAERDMVGFLELDLDTVKAALLIPVTP